LSLSADRLLRVLVGPLTFLVVCVGIQPALAGVYGDDAIYLATGESLAHGHGWTVPDLAGAPAIAKYPPLYPALLALAAFCGLDLRADIGVAVVMAGSALAWALAADRVVNGLLPRLGASTVERALVAGILGVNTVVVSTVPTVMTEGVYAFVLALQLQATGWRAAVLAALGGLTRSAGLVLDACLALGSRARVAILAGAAVAIALTGLARVGVPAAPPWLHYFAAYDVHTAYYRHASDTGGVASLVAHVAAVSRVNTVAGLASLGEFVLPIAFGGGQGSAWVYGAVLLALALWGLARRAPALLPILLGNTLLFVVWTWPFAPRFWVPVFPLVACGAVFGLGALGRLGRLLRAPIVLLFLLGNTIGPAYRAAGDLRVLAGAAPATVDPDEAALDAQIAWLDTRLGPADVLVGEWPVLWIARRIGSPGIPARALLDPDDLLALMTGVVPEGSADTPRLAHTLASNLLAMRADLPTADTVLVAFDPRHERILGPVLATLEARGVVRSEVAPAGLAAWSLVVVGQAPAAPR
jgi:hypothetical protein